MTPGHDAVVRGEHDPGVNAMQRVPTPIHRPILVCGGHVHAERGESVVLDVTATSGRTRVAFAEDGVVFCGSCAIEASRGGDDAA